jgi:hypothetical protein
MSRFPQRVSCYLYAGSSSLANTTEYRPQKRNELFHKGTSIAELALPDDHDRPPSLCESIQNLDVPLAIARQLDGPELLSRSWDYGLRAARMLMPETSVNASEYDVGLSRQLQCVKPIPISETVEQSPDSDFG